MAVKSLVVFRIRVILLAMLAACTLSQVSAWADEFVCGKYGFSVDVPVDIFAVDTAAHGDLWLRLISKSDADFRAEFSTAPVTDKMFMVEDLVMLRIKPKSTILISDLQIGDRYDTHVLAYEAGGVVEYSVTMHVSRGPEQESYFCVAVYTMPADRFEQYRPIIDRINASWKLTAESVSSGK